MRNITNIRRTAQITVFALAMHGYAGAGSERNSLPTPNVAQTETPTDAELAYRYAPVHYQDTDSSNYRADYLAAVNYDGNWDTTDNWDNLNAFPQSAVVYYSVVESCTHWFIVYAFYHPRDWEDTAFGQEHENDMEGFLILVRKSGARFGKLEGMVTVSHADFYSFIPSGSALSSGSEDVDGRLKFQSHDGVSRPKTSQEAKGHGLKAWPHTGDFRGASNEDGIVYFPSASASGMPRSGNDRGVQYALVSFFENAGLWQRQLDDLRRNRDRSATYADFGTFKGNESGGCGSAGRDCPKDRANTPWGWDDGDDGPVYAGEMALDPAHLAMRYFRAREPISPMYIRNKYLQDLAEAKIDQGDLPKGWPAELKPKDLFKSLTTRCVK